MGSYSSARMHRPVTFDCRVTSVNQNKATILAPKLELGRRSKAPKISTAGAFFNSGFHSCPSSGLRSTYPMRSVRSFFLQTATFLLNVEQWHTAHVIS
jgi:hypothetical protein